MSKSPRRALITAFIKVEGAVKKPEGMVPTPIIWLKEGIFGIDIEAEFIRLGSRFQKNHRCFSLKEKK